MACIEVVPGRLYSRPGFGSRTASWPAKKGIGPAYEAKAARDQAHEPEEGRERCRAERKREARRPQVEPTEHPPADEPWRAQLVSGYFAGLVEVNAKAFVTAIKELKSLMYNDAMS